MVDQHLVATFCCRRPGTSSRQCAPDKEVELTQLERTLVRRLNVQDTRSVHSAVDGCLAESGRIDALVNNAGCGAFGPLEATPFNRIRRQFDVNVFGLSATTKAVLLHLRASWSGMIVNVARGTHDRDVYRAADLILVSLLWKSVDVVRNANRAERRSLLRHLPPLPD